MWFADIYCDYAWVAERKGILGPPKFTLRGAKSVSLGIDIEFHFFGDDHSVRHVRVLMHTDDKSIADTCLNLNIQTWVASLEVSIMMITRRPFHIAQHPASQMFAIAQSQGASDSPAAVLTVTEPDPPKINYEQLALGFSPWGGDARQHLFYFRRFVDNSLPLDVRWLNGYRLLEWQFVGSGAYLAKSPKWRSFVARFDDKLKPLQRSNQTSVGLMEEARAMAAHAGIDARSDKEREHDPKNAMEKTFRVLEEMVATMLNEHPSIAACPVKFTPPPLI